MEGQLLQSQLKILFVDDHFGLRDAIINSLSATNSAFNFLPATNKTQALNILKRNNDISLVIMDLNLNGVNGLEVVSELRKIKNDLKVLIYTMHNAPYHIVKYKAIFQKILG